MKHLKLVLLTALLVCALCACNKKETDTEGNNEQTEQGTENGDVIDEDDDIQSEADMFDVNSLTDEQQTMEGVMKSLILCEQQGFTKYEPENADYIWNALDNLILMKRSLRSDLIKEDKEIGMIVANIDICKEYTSALFSNLTDIPERTGTFGRAVYDGSNERYLFIPEELGSLDTMISAWTDNTDGTSTVDLQLYENGAVKTTYRFTLVNNAFADTITNPVFLYSVKDMIKVQ